MQGRQWGYQKPECIQVGAIHDRISNDPCGIAAYVISIHMRLVVRQPYHTHGQRPVRGGTRFTYTGLLIPPVLRERIRPEFSRVQYVEVGQVT